ncbi:MAG: DUF2157 domain-containing protein [Hymenobacteraceae bacterium]|nr:DUF2157 domain-containing protein [Hymenobacteraceae bacterium]
MPRPLPFATDLLADLTAQRLVPPAQAAAIAEAERYAPLSLNAELRTFLYLGVTALAGGLGALLYEHHERLGPGLILSVMTALLAAAIWYAARHRPAFTWGVAPRTSVGADYALLLACLLLLGIEGYAQAQYTLFGTRYGLATALPAGVFLLLAYRYDHRGVLALGLTALAAWVGLTVAPLDVLSNVGFGHAALRGSAIGLGTLLTATACHAEGAGRKAHFASTYLSLGANLAGAGLASTLIGGWSEGGAQILGVVGMASLSAALYWFARRTTSAWFLVLAAAWGYFLLTYLWIRLMIASGGEEGAFLLSSGYFIGSAVLIIRFFLNLKRLLPSPLTHITAAE